MATIRASWKRVVQTAPYESETLELAIETTTPFDDFRDGALPEVAALSRELSSLGDQLLAERLAKRTPPPAQGPVSPDIFEPGRVVDVKPGAEPW